MPGAAAKNLAVSGLRRAPLALSMPLVRRRIRRAQADEVAVGVARRQMEFLLGASRPDADLDALALRHLEHALWRRELRFHPQRLTRLPVTGVEHLHSAWAQNRGLVVCFVHHGWYEGLFGAVARSGSFPITGVVHPTMFEAGMPPHLAAIRRAVERGGNSVPATVGFAGLREVVSQGGALAIAVDLPGSTRVRFVNRDVRCASGAARIACETGAPVVAVSARQIAPLEQELRVSEPLHPSDFSDPVSMLQTILDLMEPAVLAWPEAYDWPRAKFVQLDEEGQPISYARDPGEPDHVNP